MLLGDFFVTGDVTLGDLAEIYGLQIAASDAHMTLAEDFAGALDAHAARQGDMVPLGAIALVAQTVTDGRVTPCRPAAGRGLEPRDAAVALLDADQSGLTRRC